MADITLSSTFGVSEENNMQLQTIKNLEASSVYSIATNQEDLKKPIVIKLNVGEHFLPTKVRLQAKLVLDYAYSPYYVNSNVSQLRYYSDPIFRVAAVEPSNNADWFTDLKTLGSKDFTDILFSEPELVWGIYNGYNNWGVTNWSQYSTYANLIDLEFDIDKRLNNSLWIAIQVLGRRYTSSLALLESAVPTNVSNTFLSSRRVRIELHALNITGLSLGCGGVTVRSMDGRLSSETNGSVIEYPMLFLSRDPVKSDAENYKEVLVFRDRATTLRIQPQPIVLNEENNYSFNTVLESNGYWLLYDYPSDKISGYTDSGQSFVEGSGNDLLTIIKNPKWDVYGLYDLALHYAADGEEDEPYIVPVLLDYAKPLSVSAPPDVEEPQTRSITINFNDTKRSTEFHIFRDREWQVVGFPENQLVIGKLSGVGDTVTYLSLDAGYNVVGSATYTFIVQSGTKRVLVTVNVTISSHFSIAKFSPRNYDTEQGKIYLVLGADSVMTRDNVTTATPYKQQFCIRRKGYGLPANPEPGYTLPSLAGITFSWEAIGLTTRPVGIGSVNEPSGTKYDIITVEYDVNDVLRYREGAGGFHFKDQKITATSDGRTLGLSLYINIDFWFKISGQDKTPIHSTPLNWKIEKKYEEESYTVVGYPRQYIPVDRSNNPVSVPATIDFEGNYGVSISTAGSTTVNGVTMRLSPSASSIDLDNMLAGYRLSVSANYEHLDAQAFLKISFNSYSQFVEQGGASQGSISFPAFGFIVYYETRHPHYFFVRKSINLQWDNDWEQHVWCKTNPDAAVNSGANSFTISKLTSGTSALTCTNVTAETGYRLWKLNHPRLSDMDAPDVYDVEFSGSVVVPNNPHGNVVSRLLSSETDHTVVGQTADNSSYAGSGYNTHKAWKALSGDRITGATDSYWQSLSKYDADGIHTGSGSEWWELDFGTPTTVDNIRILAAGESYSLPYMPVKFELLCRNSEEDSFVTVKTFGDPDNIVWNTPSEWKLFPLDSPVTYRYYRLNILNLASASYARGVRLNEVEFLNGLDEPAWIGSDDPVPVTELKAKLRVAVDHTDNGKAGQVGDKVRNEVVPLMVSATQEQSVTEEIVDSDFTVSVVGDWISADEIAKVFNRKSVTTIGDSLGVKFTLARERLRSVTEYENRDSTYSFIIEFDKHQVIRSWSYSVLGDLNIVCGFLIEGQTEVFHGTDEWEFVTASSDFSTVDSDKRDESIVIDYLAVTPKPWKRLKITLTQVQLKVKVLNVEKTVKLTESFEKAGFTDATLSEITFRIGHFQFYTGYPMLYRHNDYSTTGVLSPYQRNAYSLVYSLVPGTDDYYLNGMTDGVLPTSVRWGTDDGTVDKGLGNISYYKSSPYYYNYALINYTASGAVPQAYIGSEVKFGLVIDRVDASSSAAVRRKPRITGIRYDVGVVDDYPAAAALAFETSDVVRGSTADTNVQSYFAPLLVMSAWRYLGAGNSLALGGIDTLNLDDTAVGKLETAAVEFSKVVFDDHPNTLVEGTTLMRDNSEDHDHRLVRYVGATKSLLGSGVNTTEVSDWENIGGDIMFQVRADPNYVNEPTTDQLLSDNYAALERIFNDWTGSVSDRVAFTNPEDSERLVRYEDYVSDGAGGSSLVVRWSKLTPPFDFEPNKGKTIYRNLDSTNIRTFRVHIPGLAEPFLNANFEYTHVDRDRVLLGDLQLFELFRNSSGDDNCGLGVDVALKDIEYLDSATGRYKSFLYDNVVYLPTASNSITLRVSGLAVNGKLWTTSSMPIYAMARDGSFSGLINSSSWKSIGSGTSVSAETDFTTTSLTLFFRAGSKNNVVGTNETNSGSSTNISVPNSNRMVPFFSFLILRPAT